MTTRCRTRSWNWPFDSIVLAPGFDLYDPTEKREYGYGTLEGGNDGHRVRADLLGHGTNGRRHSAQGEDAEAVLFHPVRGLQGPPERRAVLLQGCLHVYGKTCEHREGQNPGSRDLRPPISMYGPTAKTTRNSIRAPRRAAPSTSGGIPGEVVKGENGLIVRVEDMLSASLWKWKWTSWSSPQG